VLVRMLVPMEDPVCVALAAALLELVEPIALSSWVVMEFFLIPPCLLMSVVFVVAMVLLASAVMGSLMVQRWIVVEIVEAMEPNAFITNARSLIALIVSQEKSAVGARPLVNVFLLHLEPMQFVLLPISSLRLAVLSSTLSLLTRRFLELVL